ncbi:GAF domain-containing protein [Halobacillus karajensis]|uniref:Free methionine-R-sulfoxide reductase n=1 Tax=Halobacillus karajensis TaxID=195088 RepID=A0A024P755_9BACI|nr:GAF domain-containing protein [Halobacillus karajensis]CDQ18316.1 Free methionine-R-sulfoxide reductase [Halobacillus karajensis]CDQ24670.1 Free methionine-R-sulfoxide reductase [Halobacillus karajensis]CDQ29084.1 Free methionine-R-sulfoxide reductase [Halobacillus karajensis]SEI06387.1 GAF domain-containing protein [Halobacillus karajensis]
MFQSTVYTGTKTKNYDLVIKQLTSLLEDEPDPIANLANASSLLNQFLEDVNWVGFYIWRKDQLVLGPFQGLPACVRIPSGKGVCGTAVSENKVQRIQDVHAFPGHIACDAASQSEIVIPIEKNGEIYGVLDIDSPSKNRFDEVDEEKLVEFVQTLQQYI